MALQIDFVAHRKRLTGVLFLVTGLLVAAYIAEQVLTLGWGIQNLRFLREQFDLDREGNVPSLFSAALLLLAALLLAVSAKAEKAEGARWKAWAVLCWVFVGLALDEWLSLHEQLGPLVRKVYRTRGLFHFAWIIPAGLGALVFAASMVPFLLKLSAASRRAFVVAGLVYVAGAVGVEMVGGLVDESIGRGTWVWPAEVLAEESLEMIGAILFIRAILEHLHRRFPQLALRIKWE